MRLPTKDSAAKALKINLLVQPILAITIIAAILYSWNIMQQRDYIVDQIENVANFLAKLIANKNPEKDMFTLNQTLSDLTGLDRSYFKNSDINLLKTILPMISDDNTKALSALILKLINQDDNRKIYDCLMANIELKNLAPKVRALFIENGDDKRSREV